MARELRNEREAAFTLQAQHARQASAYTRTLKALKPAKHAAPWHVRFRRFILGA